MANKRAQFKERKNSRGQLEGHFYFGWSEDAAEFLAERRFKRIILEGTWQDVAFLADHAEFIEELVLKNEARVVSGVEQLRNLRSLVIPFSPKSDIDFSRLSRLESCQIYWRESYGSTLLSMPRLRDLTVFSYPERDFNGLSEGSGLASLSLVNASLQTLSGIGRFVNLQTLKLDGVTRLHTFDGIQDIIGLTELWVEKAKSVVSCGAIGAPFTLHKLTLIAVASLSTIMLDQQFSCVREIGLLGDPLNVDWNSVVRMPALNQFTAFVHSNNVPDQTFLEKLCEQARRVFVGLDVRGARKAPMVVVRIA